MNQYVTEALSIAQKLADTGNPIEDTLLATILLAGLPSEYKPMVMTLDSLNTKLTTDLVTSKLLWDWRICRSLWKSVV